MSDGGTEGAELPVHIAPLSGDTSEGFQTGEIGLNKEIGQPPYGDFCFGFRIFPGHAKKLVF